ncbi:phosphoribosylglycinamide formyltransferase [Candidatus Woesearchaeota archaeon]|nr:phosphoribosylglycinamide formyltransferase [Candidatus Woesearchaeota archaeon]
MVLKIAVLGSTKGTDLQAIIDEIKEERLVDVELSFVLSNVEDAYILERAREHKFKAVFLDPKDKDREAYDKEVDKLLQEHNVDLVLLIGYMKLMSNWFVEKWRNKVMNIHPSLLPAYAGGMDLNVHEEVLKRGCKVSGCSLIFIDEGADTGPIIIQKTCKINNDETADTLKVKVQRLEGKALLEGIKLFKDGKIKIEGKKVHILEDSKWKTIIKKLLDKI